jgi:hypothetical protein
MATRSRTTFKKRQKELARMEKQRDKAAKRVQRKIAKDAGEPVEGISDEDDPDLMGEADLGSETDVANDDNPAPPSDAPPEENR